MDARALESDASSLEAQLRSPIVVILLAAAFISWMLGDATDGVLIAVIVGVTALLGILQEHRAPQPSFLGWVGAIMLAYVGATELVKRLAWRAR